jgi:hypothetical protein
MQGIYPYIPETNNVPREYIVAAILLLLFMVPISLLIIIIIIIITEYFVYFKNPQYVYFDLLFAEYRTYLTAKYGFAKLFIKSDCIFAVDIVHANCVLN